MRLLALLCLLASASGCISGGIPSNPNTSMQAAEPGETKFPDGTSFEERLLLTLPKGVPIVNAVVNPSGRAAAYFVEQDSKQYVVFNGRKSEEYDYVSRPQISPDGKTVAYLARHGGKGFVVVNDKKGEEFPKVDKLVLSPDGKSVMYIARTGRKSYRMVVGDVKGEEFEGIDDPGLFSPDGRAFAYVASRKSKKAVVFGGKMGEEFSDIHRLAMSPDGRQIAYEASVGPSSDHKSCIVLGDRKLDGVFDSVVGPTFTPDGKILFAANRGGKATKEVLGIPVGALRGGHWIIGVGEERREVPPEVETIERPPQVAPDGTIYYIAKKDDRDFLVMGDKQGPPFAGVGGVTFSKDGKLMAHLAVLSMDAGQGPDKRLIIDGKLGDENLGNIGYLTMSPDGKAIAYRKRSRKGMQAVLGNQKSELYEIIDELTFSPDSRKLAFCARRDSEIWWKVMDVK